MILLTICGMTFLELLGIMSLHDIMAHGKCVIVCNHAVCFIRKYLAASFQMHQFDSNFSNCFRIDFHLECYVHSHDKVNLTWTVAEPTSGEWCSICDTIRTTYTSTFIYLICLLYPIRSHFMYFDSIHSRKYLEFIYIRTCFVMSLYAGTWSRRLYLQLINCGSYFLQWHSLRYQHCILLLFYVMLYLLPL